MDKYLSVGIGELWYSKGINTKQFARFFESMRLYGPDGFGVYLVSSNGKQNMIKSLDYREVLSKISNIEKIDSLFAIFRYAVFGRPAISNTPPFLDCKNRFLVIARGVLRNSYSLRKDLIKQGHLVVAREISAILAHLSEEFMHNNFEEMLRELYQKLDGYFSAYIHDTTTNQVGIIIKGPHEFYGFDPETRKIILSSEPDPIYELVSKNIVALGDGIYIVDGEGLKVIVGNIQQLDYKPGWVLGGAQYHMERELIEAIEILKLQEVAQDEMFLKVAANLVRKSRNVYLIGSGSSYHAALFGAYLLNELSNIKPNVQNATEFIYFMLRKVEPGDVIIATSQSGKTRDVIHAVSQARLKGALIIGILNLLGTPLMYASNVYIPIAAGPEVAVPATKTFIAQLATYIRLVAFIVGDEFKRRMMGILRNIPELINITRKNNEDIIKKFADESYNHENFFVLGRGINFPIALEGALKLKEVAHIHAEGMDAGEFRHGSKTLISKGIPVIFLIPQDADAREDTYNLISELRDHTKIFVVTDKDDPFAEKFAKYIARIPIVSREFVPILYAVILQSLALELGRKRKMPIDNPPQLTKYVVLQDS